MPDNKIKKDLAFLSYALEDLNQVIKIYNGLKKRKVSVWFDKEDLRPGRWKKQIINAISQSKYFIICISNATLEKMNPQHIGFVNKELQTAWEFACEQDENFFTIIPVRLEDCGYGDNRLASFHQFNLYEDWEGIIDKIAVHLGGISLTGDISKHTIFENQIDGRMDHAIFRYNLGRYEKALSMFETASKKCGKGTITWCGRIQDSPLQRVSIWS